jgi:DNA (cytosine-5)-methyltransferase 1
MRLLDVFCGAGGAAEGYRRGGFDEIVGVDLTVQKHYPFQFVRADALAVLDSWDLDSFDLIHASPPCQDHSTLRHVHEKEHGTGWLLAATRELLSHTGTPWIIENVPGAPMRADYKLCGCMFGLPRLRRQRWFETSWHGFDLRAPCYHVGKAITVAGHGAQGSYEYDEWGFAPTQEERREAMGIYWMNRGELAQAIPPVFTEYLSTQVPVPELSW